MPSDPRQHVVGVSLLIGAAIAWSTAGVFVRIVQLDSWTILFWRGLFATGALSAMLLVVHGRRMIGALRLTGAGGLMVAGCDVLVSVTFILALNMTSVADVAVIYATAPIITAGLAWLCLRERPGFGVIAAGAISVLGVAIVVSGEAGQRHLVGNAMAVLMTLMLAVMTLLIRVRRTFDLTPAALLSAAITAAVTWPLAAPAVPGAEKLAWLALFATLQMALGLVLFILGSRRVPAGEAVLLTLLETPLAPFWVWLVIGETPSTATVFGGALVGAAILIHLAAQYRWRIGRRRPATWGEAIP